MDRSGRELAGRQLADYRARTPGTVFAGEGRSSLSLDEAYSVQGEVARLRAAEGEPVAGYKVGATGPGTREQFGMDGPIRGFLYQTELHRSRVKLSYASYANLAIEGNWPSGSATTRRSGASCRLSSCITTSSALSPPTCRS